MTKNYQDAVRENIRLCGYSHPEKLKEQLSETEYRKLDSSSHVDQFSEFQLKELMGLSEDRLKIPAEKCAALIIDLALQILKAQKPISGISPNIKAKKPRDTDQDHVVKTFKMIAGLESYQLRLFADFFVNDVLPDCMQKIEIQIEKFAEAEERGECALEAFRSLLPIDRITHPMTFVAEALSDFRTYERFAAEVEKTEHQNADVCNIARYEPLLRFIRIWKKYKLPLGKTRGSRCHDAAAIFIQACGKFDDIDGKTDVSRLLSKVVGRTENESPIVEIVITENPSL